MPFDPNQPQNGELIDAVQLRDQFNGLKALIDTQPVTSYGRVAADWTSGSASFAGVTGLSFAVAAGESWTAELALAVVSGSGGQGLKFRVAGPGAASVLISMQGTGPGASWVAYGNLLSAYSGFAAPNGRPGDEPRTGLAWADPLCGLFMAFAVVAALRKRDCGGGGRHIDFSMLEGLLWTMPGALIAAQLFQVEAPPGNGTRPASIS